MHPPVRVAGLAYAMSSVFVSTPGIHTAGACSSCPSLSSIPTSNPPTCIPRAPGHCTRQSFEAAESQRVKVGPGTEHDN
eukprot:554250-Pyramimonas_sp.AAC.4